MLSSKPFQKAPTKLYKYLKNIYFKLLRLFFYKINQITFFYKFHL